MELKFELGQWVVTEDGYGQIIYIRPYYIEDYEDNRKGRRNGEFIRYLYICKILCNFEGKIRKQKRINVYTSLSVIDKVGREFVKKIKTELSEEYKKFILYDTKENICDQLFIYYKIDTLHIDLDNIKEQIWRINNKLYPAFTYNEFKNLFNEYSFPFKLNNIIEYGQSNKGSIVLRFDSDLFKTIGKEAIFNNVRVVNYHEPH